MISIYKDIRVHFNRQLTLACLLIAISTFNYGFDNQGFATTQAMNSFTRQFGVYNSKTKKYALETYWLSLFNSLMYIGFGAGMCLVSLKIPTC
jgi:SP family sugar:H+ symporter-like MFS transporter